MTQSPLRWLFCRTRFFQFYVGEDRGFERGGDVGANSEAHVEGIVESYKFNRAGRFQLLAGLARVHSESAAFLDDAQARWAVFRGDDLIGLFIGRAAKLE